ncbi:MAG: hypothetical protein ABIG45_07520 [Bacillota bacterium]
MPESGSVPRRAEDAAGAFSYNQGLNRREAGTEPGSPRAYTPNYGPDRSAFVTGDPGAPRGDTRFAPPPKFDKKPRQPGLQPEPYGPGDGYQVRSERPLDGHNGGKRGRGWLTFLVVLLVLALIAGGAYFFRYQILDLVGQIFGEELVWKIVPTPAPTEAGPGVPAYVNSTTLQIKSRAQQEISAVAGELDLNTDAVTDQSIVLRSENRNGTFDYYLFAYDTGRLLGYYEALHDFIACDPGVFYIAQAPYLITSRGFPLADPASFARSAGGDVKILPMINGWAPVSNLQGTMLNFVGEDGALISDLWFAKTFPFTADTTLGYVDTGNLTDPGARYALYLLKLDGETKRLSYVADMNGVMESVCGMAFMYNGEMRAQDEALTIIARTDDAAAYVNCGALVVRDPGTGLYGLFVDGVQQYPFEFEGIGPMPSDLVWAEYANGYVRRYTVANRAYPLPRSYSFILRRGGTEQVVSIAAASVYPLVFD